MPNFTTRTYKSFAAAVKDWESCPPSMHPSIGILFSAVAFLQTSGDITAVCAYSRNYLLFS